MALWSDGGRPLDRAFTSLLASLLAEGKLAPVVIAAADASGAEAAARQLGARSLARLTLSVERGALTARGDAFSTWVNFFSGRTPTRTGPALALVATVEGDAEALALAGAPPPEGAGPRTPIALTTAFVTALRAAPSALAVGDVDGDGKPEILLLLGEELQVYGLDARLLGSASVATAPLALSTTREPFGALAVTPPPVRIVAWSARRAKAAIFTWDRGLKAAGFADQVVLDGLALRLEPGFNRFLPDASFGGKPLPLGAPVQATSTRGGVTLLLWTDGAASLIRGLPPAQRLLGIGCGSTLADVDGDGTPELIATSARTSGDGDEVRVVSLASAEQLQARGASLPEAPSAWQGASRGRVVAAAAGDLDGDGAEDVVLAGWLADDSGELVVLKGAKP